MTIRIDISLKFMECFLEVWTLKLHHLSNLEHLGTFRRLNMREYTFVQV